VPQPKITRSQTAGTNGAPVGDVTPEEAAAIRSSVAGKEMAPSSRIQSVYTDWRKVADQLGDPFEVERIPVSKLRQMRRDPMLGFGLSFIKTPHVRAKWFISASDNNGPNAQVAAHVDHDLRRIFASFVLQWCNSLDFGFSAIAKRFEFRTPSGTYINVDPNTGEQSEAPIWSEGGIQPIAWKPFVALRPEGVMPVWSNLGEFDGIEYTPTADTAGSGGGGGGGAPSGTGASSGGGSGGTNKTQTFKIDLPHALWSTQEKDANFGSIFGYPRLGYAYKYWWSYWFRWAIADRAFERKADPSVLVYHPDGEFVNEETGERMSHSDYAVLMGERMRSGGVIALPSEVYEDANGRGVIRQWEIDFTKDSVNFEPFDKSFDYLDIQKLRALWIPEQAFLEGKGGTSSRNVAAELGESFVESQAVMNAQIVNDLNRYVIPQHIAVNYPEFLANGGTAEIKVQGFGDEDVNFMLQLIQLIGQQDAGMREILKMTDLQKILEDRGTPILPFAQQQKREQDLAAAAQAAAPPTGVSIPPGGTGPVPTATGFSYMPNYREETMVVFADSGSQFVENLPKSPHYEDKTVRGFARQLWTMYRDLYRDEYESAIETLLDENADAVEASDEDLALADFTGRAARLISKWQGSKLWPNTLSRSLDLMGNIMRRAAKVELMRTKSRPAGSNPSIPADDMDGWLRDHIATFASKVAETTRTEVRDFIAKRLEEGVTDRKDLADEARKRFGDFPDWKADRLVRTEVRDLYNAATLFAAQSIGVDRVQALDAQVLGEDTDDDCINRNGRIFSVKQAFREDEHPNGTLAWRMVPVELAIEKADIEGAEYNEDENLLTLSNKLDDEVERRILMTVLDRIA
jgi:hypothetical protein